MPVPVYTAQYLALGQQDSPQNVEDTFALPALHGAMDADVIAELLGKMIPLAAGASAIDDPIERLALVDPGAPYHRRRVIDGKHSPHRLPKVVWHVPDRRQCFGVVGCPGDGWYFDYVLAHALVIGRNTLMLKPLLLT